MSRIRLSLLVVFISLGLFSLFRLLLLYIYYSEFAGLTVTQIIQAFVYGLRFDFALVAALLGIPLLLLNLPLKFCENKPWGVIWYWVCFILVVSACFLLTADLVYYSYVEHHITSELKLLLYDYSFIVHIALTDYKNILILFAVFSITLFLLWYKLLPVYFISNSRKKQLAIFALLFITLIVGIRGSLQRKPIHIIDAYTNGNYAQGNLVLNGAYSALRSFDSRPSVSRTFYSQAELYKQARELGLSNGNTHFPFQRQFNGKQPTRLNIVLVLLESWSYRYVDALAGNNYGITPNLDRIIEDGLAFKRFYAAGQRSIDGLQAILTSMPNLVDLPTLGWGLENTKFTRLGNLLQKNGYHTLFAQSSRRTSFHLDSIAAATGFKEYYGMEDMELELGYADPGSFWYGWDHETFNKVHSRLANIEPPFFSFIFTGSTHGPYGTLPERFHKYPHSTYTEQGFMNTIFYTDWAIGEFMKQARQQPWFDDTVFIFTADHTVGAFRSYSTTEQYHIPMVIFSPKHIKAGINTTISSHFDIMPTIIDLLGLPDRFSTVGKSLLREKDNIAYIRAGNIMGVISNKGYLRHSLMKTIEAKTLSHKDMDKATREELERHLLTFDQITYQSITSNKWAE